MDDRVDARASVDGDVVERIDLLHAGISAAQRKLLSYVAECDRQGRWRRDGCRDMAQWLSARLGIANWTARRWIDAAHALPSLPCLSAALESGTLSLDKTVELCRFATPKTERNLISWARRVTVWGIRRKADLAARPDREGTIEADRSRFLSLWWFDDGKRLGLEGSFPADQGAVIAKALDRMAGRMPDIVADDDPPVAPEEALDVRRADALASLASSAIADDGDADRATVVVHAPLAALVGDAGGCEIEGGPVIHPETARRLLCDGREETVVYDGGGHALGIGRASRTVPPWLLRQLRQRDGGCTFPGCESRRWLNAHHVRHWLHGGRTDLDNLVLVCTWHHRLVHERGWKVKLGACGVTTWFRPGGRHFDPGLAARELPERAPPMVKLDFVA
ncbi:MAG: DUF222 domain-containing protein [Actinomycetota bacterium]